MLSWHHNPLLLICFVLTVVSSYNRSFNNKMVKVCEVKWSENFCETVHSVHTFPPESNLKLMSPKRLGSLVWVKFVQVKCANFPHPVASCHMSNNFCTSDYQYWGHYQSKFVNRMILCKEAVPSTWLRLCKSHPPQEGLGLVRLTSNSGIVVYRTRRGRCDDDKNILVNKRRRTVIKLQVARFGIYI